MGGELKNQALVAAAVAKQNGFENTYKALIEVAWEVDQPNPAIASHTQNSAKQSVDL